MKFIQHSTNLAAGIFPSQFLFNGGFLRTLEDSVAVGVDGQGQTVGLADVPDQQEVASSILLFTKETIGHFIVGIIDGCYER
jgi:hypothetical protein